MCKHNCESHGHHDHDHHHHHETSDHHHHHDEKHEAASPLLSSKERLVKRLEVYVHHNIDHAASYENLVDEAIELGGEQAAQLIRAAAEFTARQNENLEKALSILRSL
jgi:hypothetical protein